MQHRVARFGIRFFDPQQHVAPDDHPRQILRACFRSFDIADRFAVAHHGDVIRNLQHFVEFVRDDDDRFALFAHPAQNIEKIY